MPVNVTFPFLPSYFSSSSTVGFLFLSPFPGTLLKALEGPVLFCAVEEHFGPDSHLHYNRFYSTLAVERNHEMNIDHSNLKLLYII